jgi:hypothetical protein
MRLPPLLQTVPGRSLVNVRRWHHAVSRRSFLRAAAGTAALAYGTRLLGPVGALAAPPGTGTPKPIPGGAPELGGVFHLFLPAPGAEPATITDFNGFTGLAVLRGPLGRAGGHGRLHVWGDMRFMKGLFVGTDGESRQETFGFWIDLFSGSVDPTFATQIHDFNPGIEPFPSGLFWTTKLPRKAVHVDLPDAIATMEVADLDMEDYFNVFNALSGGPSAAATVSFDVDWGPAIERYQASDAVQDFSVRGWLTGSSMTWSAVSGGATYESMGDATSALALVVKERNGRFFPWPPSRPRTAAGRRAEGPVRRAASPHHTCHSW